ncbi:MAG: calcium/sodium antiporter [Oscillospiraceae bacterium]|nr:calcium/sodium antiporter [Oscillospiraceae bacterium]
MILSVLLFAVGLVLLIKGGDWFVDGATGIAKRFNLPDIVVGATVVSIGTTLPEVMVSTTGALQGSGAMAYGNAIGSIICNTALIAAISIVCNPGPVNTKSMKTPALFFFGSAALYCLASYVLGTFPRWMGFVMLSIFVVYMILTVRNGMKNPDEAEHEEEEDGKKRTLITELILLVVGAAVIAVGADLLVEHGQIIAIGLGVPETVVALLFVALGTSLPELVTTITSLRSGHASLGVGNVIGANVFNLVLVSGVAVSLAPFDVPCENYLLNTGLNMSLVFELPVMLGVMSLMIFPTLASKKLQRWQGILLLGIYLTFCICQFVL